LGFALRLDFATQALRRDRVPTTSLAHGVIDPTIKDFFAAARAGGKFRE
jgi:hypothetical protein